LFRGDVRPTPFWPVLRGAIRAAAVSSTPAAVISPPRRHGGPTAKVVTRYLGRYLAPGARERPEAAVDIDVGDPLLDLRRTTSPRASVSSRFADCRQRATSAPGRRPMCGDGAGSRRLALKLGRARVTGARRSPAADQQMRGLPQRLA
jgi:hypothetical protein